MPEQKIHSIPGNPVEVFHKGWPGMSVNFPSEDDPVWVFQYCNVSQTRGESHPFIQTLLWELELWDWADGEGRFVSFIAMETEQQHLIGSGPQLLREKAREAAIEKFSKICLRHTKTWDKRQDLFKTHYQRKQNEVALLALVGCGSRFHAGSVMVLNSCHWLTET